MDIFSDFQRRNFGLQTFSKSCWSGLERKFCWFAENKDFFRKFKVFHMKGKLNHPEVTCKGNDNELFNNPVGKCHEDEENDEMVKDVFDIKLLLEKLKLSLVQANNEQLSAVVDENEILRKELRILRSMVHEKDKKIQQLEKLLCYDNEMFQESTSQSFNI